MKILHIVENLSPEAGGTTKVVRELTETLAKRGIEISIFTTAGKNNERIQQIKGVDLKLFRSDFLARWWPGHSSGLAKSVMEEAPKFDLIHIHEIWHHPHFTAYTAAKRAKKPYIITVHGALEPWCLNYKAFKKKIFAALFERRILKEASVIHVLTEEETRNIQSFGVNNFIAVIPNGLDPKEFQNLPGREELEHLYPTIKGKQVILFLGRIHPKKGLDILARAFGKIAKEQKNICLLVAGPNNNGYQTRVENILKEEGVLDKVIFAGMLTGQDKLAALSGSDFFVLPSYSEGFSMGILEAMICGLPVIITNQCNFPDVSTAKTGEVIEPNENQLVKTLNIFLNNQQLRKKRGENARNLIMEKFTWDKITNQMIELYEDVLNRTSK
ncbi:MAG TPA: glycosyltransferase [Elusimicrobia bacterium]|jgi:glycosyltransferase involved in cell wall biosynthesis|nr:glycosyltransferase [Elusimicrobiota bacterium]